MWKDKKDSGIDLCFRVMVLFVVVVILWAILTALLSVLEGLNLLDHLAAHRALQ